VIRRGDHKGFTIIDALITLCFIGILIGVVIPKYQRVAREAQEVAVKTGLVNIRMSVRLFKVLNNRNPESLKELTEKRVILPARIGTDRYSGSFFDQNYLMSHAVDSKGNIVDAFGNPFAYDPARGEVKATTKGCENW
jgi:competence protein ComGC